jgi:hypothetical protein
MSPGLRRHALSAFVCLLTALAAAPVSAQSPARSASAAQTRSRPEAHPGSETDFMFGRPRASISVRGSWVFARAGSDLFEFVSDQLTLDKRDFDAPALGTEVGIALMPRLEVLGTFDVSQSKNTSEYRDFIDNNNQPIVQQTETKNVHVGGSLKYSLAPRGQSISRLAWIPRGVSPYVGGGAGAVYYRFYQVGDFVDFVDSSVFYDRFVSNGWAPSAHAFGGVDLQLYRSLFLQVEGRYRWAKAELGPDFVDFDPIDLSGFAMTTGISFLF